MALKYTGFADRSAISVIIYGDGVSSSISIDPTQSPFDIDFSKGGPTAAFLGSAPSDPKANVVLEGGGTQSPRLIITFEWPPPEVSLLQPSPGGRQLVIKFLYG